MTDQDVAGLLRLRQLRDLHRILTQTLATGVFSCAIGAWFVLVNLFSGFALHHTRRFKRSRTVSARTVKRCLGDSAAMALTIVGVPVWLLTRSIGFDFTPPIHLLTGLSCCGTLTLAAALSSHPATGPMPGDQQASRPLFLAVLLLSDAYTTLRCVRIQARRSSHRAGNR